MEVAILMWNQRNWIFFIVYMIPNDMNVKLAIKVENSIYLDVC